MGPSCFFIDGEQTLSNNGLINVMSQDLASMSLIERIPILLERIKQLKLSYLKNNSKATSQVFSVQPKVQMSLLLTFESYDQSSFKGDLYMPEEKIIKFNIGYLKLNFKGKLKLSHTKDVNGVKLPTKSGNQPSLGTYGIVESDGKPVYN